MSTVIAPAVRLWLRSQVQSAAHLEAEIQGNDRQILGGYVPKVGITAQQVVYQGLHLSRLDLQAENIRVNIGQILRGKPLRLLAIVPVAGTVQISQTDLTESHRSPLLTQALRDLFALWLPQLVRNEPWLQNISTSTLITQPKLTLQNGGLLLSAELQGDRSAPLVGHIATQLRQTGPATLEFYDTCWVSQVDRSQHPLEAVTIDLGAEVTIAQLHLTTEEMHCQGKVNVIPAIEPAAP